MREVIERAQQVPGPGEYEVDTDSLLARQRRLADRSAPSWHILPGSCALAHLPDHQGPLPLVAQGVCSHSAQKEEARRRQNNKSWGVHNQRKTSRVQVSSNPDLFYASGLIPP